MLKTHGLVKTAPGVGNIAFQDVTIAEPQTDEVTIEVAAAGICGTDLHIIDGDWPVNPPIVIGHELSGTVSAIGPDVDDTWLGARVVSEVFYSTDGTCDACRDGHRNLCPNRRNLGSHVNGAFTSHVVAPLNNLHIVPPSIDLTSAALLEPLACVLGALADPPVVNPGDRVLVVGPGAIGVLAAQVARSAGAEVTLIGREPDRRRLEVASVLAITTHIDDGQLPSAWRDSFHVVIEASGAPTALDRCISAVRRRGHLVQLGIFHGAPNVNINAVCLKELTVTSGYGATPAAFRRAIALADRGLVNLDALVTDVAPLADWEATLAATRAGNGLKFLFNPRLA